jgi:hypothetical protein
MQFLTETEKPHTSAQLFADHLALIGKDIQAWVNLFAEDNEKYASFKQTQQIR